VTVHFRIGPEGEIGDVRLERPSADATYDESVLRAVREASPLPPPPAAHQRDFGDVRLTFRPGDLREPG
jgi:TonB family protein